MNFLLEPGFAIYIAMAVALAVWLGIFAFIWRVDQQARELRRRLDQPQAERIEAPRTTIEKVEKRSNRPTTATNE
jgi:CcmD family protein